MNDFHLMSLACGDDSDSPCIDAGNPFIQDSLLGCSWGQGTSLSDMGAFAGGDSIYTAIEIANQTLPDNYLLSQNYPNPFNAQTTIEYELPNASDVSMSIFDITGRKLETLIDGYQEAGLHQKVWDAKGYSSGVYFYSIQAEKYNQTRRALLLK
jgi:hypothetical protein